MLNAPVALEIEYCFLAERGDVEVAIGNDELVVLGLRFRDDLAVGIHDDAARDQGMAVLDAALGDCHHPGRVLISARLHCRR